MAPIVIDLVSSDDDERPAKKRRLSPVAPVPQKPATEKHTSALDHQARIRREQEFRRKEAESAAFHNARDAAITVEESSATPEATLAGVHLPASLKFTGSSEGFGGRYSAQEDEHLLMLRDEHKVSWEDMPTYFTGRTQGSLQVRYSGLRRRSAALTAAPMSLHDSFLATDSDTVRSSDQRPRRGRKKETRPGYISWEDIKARKLVDDSQPMAETGLQADQASMTSSELSQRSLSVPTPPMGRSLRARELGNARSLRVCRDLQNSVLDTLGPRRMFNGTAGDVTCVAWRPDSNKFATGSIAISDISSMQYNRPYNLLLGDIDRNTLLELPEHHVERPVVDSSVDRSSSNPRPNVNGSHEMRATQDSRVFMTVAAVDFDATGQRLFTAGGDRHVRMYSADDGRCLDALNLDATVDMLVCVKPGLLAVARHTAENGIKLLEYDSNHFINAIDLPLPPTSSSVPVFPSALKAGGPNNRFLLAGFASDGIEEERAMAGGIGLWDLHTRTLLETSNVSRGVFDVAWNSSLRPGSTLFAVAVSKLESRTPSEVQCFSWDRLGIRRTLTWDCPALDINDVIYCPHDDNLIAAGATDGKVYIWDKRFVDTDQAPLHVLKHGKSENVLDPERDREVADTGARFLSWSATANRLYSGSSDGVVKVWDPYKSTGDAFVRDIARFDTAVMSGAFSVDHRDLLIGEERGQINLLSIDREGRSVRTAKRFDLRTAPPAQPAMSTGGDATMDDVEATARPEHTDDALAGAVAKCTLDCNFIPTAADEDGTMPDNRASEQRIPGVLRNDILPRKWMQATDYTDLTNAEIEEDGPFVSTRVTQRCKRCSYPVRPNVEEGRPSCQRCEFRCFRCAEVASYNVHSTKLECVPCGLVWEGGILGWELCETTPESASVGSNATLERGHLSPRWVRY